MPEKRPRQEVRCLSFAFLLAVFAPHCNCRLSRTHWRRRRRKETAVEQRPRRKRSARQDKTRFVRFVSFTLLQCIFCFWYCCARAGGAANKAGTVRSARTTRQSGARARTAGATNATKTRGSLSPLFAFLIAVFAPHCNCRLSRTHWRRWRRKGSAVEPRSRRKRSARQNKTRFVRFVVHFTALYCLLLVLMSVRRQSHQQSRHGPKRKDNSAERRKSNEHNQDQRFVVSPLPFQSLRRSIIAASHGLTCAGRGAREAQCRGRAASKGADAWTCCGTGCMNMTFFGFVVFDSSLPVLAFW